MELYKNKRDVIIRRLKKTAAELWDYQESETDGFDPVVDLLMGACATEFEKLSTEIHTSQSRIIEKVAQTILPEVSLRPRPTYAILHSKPTKRELLSNKDDQFVFEKEFIGNTPNKVEQKKLYFSPASSFRLIDAEPIYLATTHEIVEYTDLVLKQSFALNGSFDMPQRNTLWLALDINKAVDSLENISFYFDWFDNPERDWLINLIPLSKWYINNKEIHTKSGFSELLDEEYNEVNTDVFHFLNINLSTEKKIINFFKRNFITINESIVPETQLYPQEFREYFSADVLDKMTDELCWIRIDLPDVFPVKHLITTFCTANAYPVINRRLHNSNRPYTLNDDLNILPLDSEDFFFTIKDITSSNHINYQEVPFRRVSDFAPGTFTIRTEGVKRFDTRDAYDFIQYLIELSREEHVVFKSLGSSLIDKELNDLLVILNRLRLNVSKSKDLHRNTHFIIVKSETVEDVWLEFWSTTGEFANNLPVGSSCFHSDFDKKTLRLITPSMGGKNPPDDIDRTYLFKSELLTRDRIVTEEDIRLSCFAEYGDELDKVLIQKKPIIGTSNSHGIQKCICVELSFKDEKSSEEKHNIILYTKDFLEQRSSCLFPYHVECT